MLLDIFRLIFPEFKYLERAKNFTKIRSLKQINLQKDIILASLLTDSSNNHEYFFPQTPCFQRNKKYT